MNVHDRLPHLLFLLALISAFETDLYKILGIANNATVPQIKEAYRRLALIKHPDKNLNDPTAHLKFTELSQAYSTLIDKSLRHRYDTKDWQSSGEKHESKRSLGAAVLQSIIWGVVGATIPQLFDKFKDFRRETSGKFLTLLGYNHDVKSPQESP